MNIFTKKSGWLFTIGVFCILLLPNLLEVGLFIDGLYYGTLSMHISEGIGSFWSPILDYDEPFFGHLPLAIWLQAAFFKLFGDAFYMERIYALACAIFTAIGIVLNWNLFFDKTKAWLPVLLWITTPLVFWSYQSGVLENTVTVFCLFSSYLFLRALKNHSFFLSFLGGILLVCAFLSKGITSIFLLALPIIAAFIEKEKRTKSALLHCLIYIGTFVVFTLIILASDPIREYLHNYFNIQVFRSLAGQNEITTSSHILLLRTLLEELLAPIILFVIALILKMINKKQINYNPKTFLFLVIALSAFLPLLISPKQRAFYLIPAIPYFIIFLAYFINLYIPLIGDFIERKLTAFLGIILIIGACFLMFRNFGNYNRDEIIINDVKKLSLLNINQIGLSEGMCFNYYTKTYIIRLEKIITTCNTSKSEYIILDKKEPLPNGFTESDKAFSSFLLAKKIYH